MNAVVCAAFAHAAFAVLDAFNRRFVPVAAAAVFGIAAPALAPSDALARGADVYVAAIEDDVKPIVVFVFSDPATPDYAPLARFAFYFVEDYKKEAGARFDPRAACRFTNNFSDEIPEKFQREPIYGPNAKGGFGPYKDQQFLTPIDVPSYMAQQAVVVLFREAMIVSERDSIPYFNCAGFMWSVLLAQPDGVYDELYGDQLGLR